METQSPPPIDLPVQAWRYLVHTLYTLLPPPAIDTPEAVLVRNQAAIARIADLSPVNANEAELATQCIIARAQAEDVMRLVRRQDGQDIKCLVQLNNQYSRMVRTSLDAYSHLLRAQQLRRKLEAKGTNADEWIPHIAAEQMQTAAPLEPQPPATQQEFPRPENKSHDTGNETSIRQPDLPVVERPAATQRPAPKTRSKMPPRTETPAQEAPAEDNNTIWANAMLRMARGYTDNLDRLPPKAREEAIMNSQALNDVARDLLAGNPMPPAMDRDP